MKCLSCARGFLNECRGGDCETLTGNAIPSPVEGDDNHTQDRDSSNEQDTTEDVSDRDGSFLGRNVGKAQRYRRTKPDAALKDQQSTGRKRAARLYPLDRNAPCEWRGKKNQGGGDNPIQGCTDGMQLNRHHGPDKNTLNNEPGNVHRICTHCHNRWHAKNDPDYDPNKPLKD